MKNRIFLWLKGSYVVALTLTSWAGANLEIVSKPHTNAPISLRESVSVELADLSANGKWALLTSESNELLPGPPLQFTLDVFLRNLETGDTKLISRGTDGERANGTSVGLAISGDARYLLIESEASNLVAGDTNECSDLFLYDVVSDEMTVISRNGDEIGNASSEGAVMTPNGRFVVFESNATNLTPNDTNNTADLFLFDRETRTLKLITENYEKTAPAYGTQSAAPFDVSITPDGRYVAFLSTAMNLVSNLPPIVDPQLYVRDMSSGATFWINQQVDRAAGQFATNPCLSTNGEYIAFISSDLVVGPASIAPSTYVYLNQWQPFRSIRRLPDPAEIPSSDIRSVQELVMTPDAKYLAYVLSHNSPSGPLSYALFLFDPAKDTNRLVSISTNGTSARGGFSNIAISNDGRFITFVSNSPDLVPGANANLQLYRFDQETGKVQLLSRNGSSEPADDDVLDPIVSADDSTVGFLSFASNLSAEDDSPAYDVFILPTDGSKPPALLPSPSTNVFSATAAGASKVPFDSFYPEPRSALTVDGRYAAFSSSAWNLTPNDTNTRSDIFIRDLRTQVTTAASLVSEIAPQFVGMARDGSVIAFHAYAWRAQRQISEVHVYDVASGRDLMEGLFPDPAPGDMRFGVYPALSSDGRYIFFERFDSLGRNRTASVRDLRNNTTTELAPVQYMRSSSFSAGGNYVIFETMTYPSSLSLVVEWRTGATNLVKSVYVASTSDDSQLLLKSARGFAQEDLFLFSPSQNSSNLIATNTTFQAMSLDGSTIVYNELSPTNSRRAVVFNTKDKTRTLLPLRADGNVWEFQETPSLSDDGRFIAFSSKRENGRNDADYLDVYVYDRVLTNLTLLSQTPAGALPNLPSRSPSVSGDGRTVVFESLATNLVPDDRNLESDVFVARLSPVDSDQDGLEDGWEIMRFGNFGAKPEDDSDGDGLTNAQEFTAGTDPTDASAFFRIELVPRPSEGELTLTWKAVQGKTYQVLFGSTLGLWQSVSDAIAATQDVLSVKIQADAQGAGFYRIQVVE